MTIEMETGIIDMIIEMEAGLSALIYSPQLQPLAATCD